MKVNTTRIKLENIFMDAVIKEDTEIRANVTDKPVEKGQDISDHYKKMGARIDLSGCIVNDSEEKYEELKGFMKEAKLLTYIGNVSFKNVVITTLVRKDSSSVKDGYDYDITLQEVRIAIPETFEVKVKNPVTGSQDKKTATKVKKFGNKGRKQLVNARRELNGHRQVNVDYTDFRNYKGFGGKASFTGGAGYSGGNKNGGSR